MCLSSIVMTDATIPRIVSFANGVAEITRSRPSSDRLLDGDPQHTARNLFSDATGQMFCGIWESSPGRWRVSYTENEFCHITAGEVQIESEDGEVWTFSAGDSFVIPAGFAGTWNVPKALSKLYVIFEPASS